MPWCEDCAKFWTPSSMAADGSCPSCGRVLQVADRAGAAPITPQNLDLKKLAGKDAKAPWHFKVLMALLIIYLTWRLVQLVLLVF
jgi:hypothetical protein